MKTEMTKEYYRKNAAQYHRDTINLDMSEIYSQFCQYLKPGDRILDAGSGSGRDIIAFKKMGYEVEAFDLSPELAEIATNNSGINVLISSFHDYKTDGQFDGIWCCASLLHVPLSQLAGAIKNLSEALKQNGVIYVSFKYGTQEREKEGLHITDMDEAGLSILVNEIKGLHILKVWKTDDTRADRKGKWLNVILKKI